MKVKTDSSTNIYPASMFSLLLILKRQKKNIARVSERKREKNVSLNDARLAFHRHERLSPQMVSLEILTPSLMKL